MTHGSALAIERRVAASGEVVALRGELDLTNAHQLGEALEAAPTFAVVLDLSELGFIDSAGIRTIDQARRRLERQGRLLLVVAPPESRAGWTFRVAGLADGAVLDSLEQAVERAVSRNGDSPMTSGLDPDAHDRA